LQRDLNARLIAGIDRSRSTAIDGLRHLLDFESLTAAYGAAFSMIFMDATPENRFERLRSRFSDIAEFRLAEVQPVESYSEKLRMAARFVVANNGTLAELHARLDACVAECL